MDRKSKNKLAIIFMMFYRIYKILFFINNGNCKFIPTCSKYAEQAIINLPIHIAFVKIIWRIMRCNPFSKGGYDPIIEIIEREKSE